MKQLVSIVSAFMVLTSAAHSAQAADVHSSDHFGNVYVKISKSKSGHRVSFAICMVSRVDGTKDRCKRLGKKNSYSVSELESQHSEELREIAYSTVGAAGGLVVGAFAGVFALFGADKLNLIVVSDGLGQGLGAMAAGGTAGLVADVVIDELNPFEQYAQSSTISKDVIQDKPIVIDGGDKAIYKFADRLETVLNKID